MDHNATDLAGLRKQQARYDRDMEDYIRAINQLLGKMSCTSCPSARPALRYVKKFAPTKAPGLKTQTDLFRDNWDHPQIPLQVLDGYYHFAVIYRRSPPPSVCLCPTISTS